MNLKIIGLLSISHFIVDINQGALPAILPFFIGEYGLSYSAAATIVFATNSASAIVQPIFGYAADKFNKMWLLPVSLILAGLGIGLSGIVESYQLIIILTAASGIGIAAFHPQAARLVNIAAGRKKGTSMSFFGLGGTAGFAVGPMIATSALLYAGLTGTLLLIIPVTVMALVVLTQYSNLGNLEKEINGGNNVQDQIKKVDQWLSFWLLSSIILGRSVIFFGVLTFVPLYWTGYFGSSIAQGGIALSTFAISGAFGNFFGGWLSDRIGQKKMMVLGFSVLLFALGAFVFTTNPIVALILLVPVGFSHSSTYSPSIVLGQEYLPNHVGFSSGVTLGLSVAFGGIAAPFIGMLADAHGIWYAMALVASLPIVNIVLSVMLPRIRTESEVMLKPALKGGG